MIVVVNLNTPDKNVAQIYQSYKNELNKDMNELISYSVLEMTIGRSDNRRTTFFNRYNY